MQNSKASFPKLNLPAADLKLIKEDGRVKVLDTLRGRYVALTPEEWVRQHFVSFLINHRSYPKSLMANEVALSLNSTDRRADTIVYDRKARPLMVVEYKSADVELTQKVFEQAVRYNITLKAKYIVLSNGLRHICLRQGDGAEPPRFLPDIPPYDEL